MRRARVERSSVFSREVISILDSLGAVRSRESIKSMLCNSLRTAYKKTPLYQFVIDVTAGAPFEPGPQISYPENVEDPGGPDEPVESISLGLRPTLNPHAIEILEEALELNCDWAKKEAEKLGGKLPDTD